MTLPRVRFTIGRVMVWIAAVACSLALPRRVAWAGLLSVAGVAAVIAALALLSILFGAVFGHPCPVCTRWTLRRLARHRHYFRCSECRARLKRFPFAPWLDASGAEDSWRYRAKAESKSLEGLTVPEDLDGSTSGHLLRGKRSRGRLAVETRPSLPTGSGRRTVESQRKVGMFFQTWGDIREARGEDTTELPADRRPPAIG